MPSKTTKDPENPIPERIVERMAAKNQNFAQAAREIGTTQAALQYVVNRGRGLGRDLAPRFAVYLGIDESDLFQMAGLAPSEAKPDEGIYEKQIRALFRRATPQQKKQIVDVANIILSGGAPSQSGQRKPRGSES